MENDIRSHSNISWNKWDNNTEVKRFLNNTHSHMLLDEKTLKQKEHNKQTVLKKAALALGLAATTTAIQYCAVQKLSEFNGSNSADASIDGAINGNIAVATHNLQANRMIEESDVEFKKITGNECIKSMISDNDATLLRGKMLSSPINTGSPISHNEIFVPQTRRRLMTQVPMGKQLYSLAISDQRLAQSLRPGDRVDVVGNLQLPNKGFVTRTLLSGAILAGIETGTSEVSESAASSLFFFLESKDTEFLTHAKRYGEFVIVAKNANDTSPPQETGMTQNQFLDDPRIRNVYESDLFHIQDGEKTK